MSAVEYKVFFDGTSATQDQLDKIEEVVVDQTVDRAWEARLQIPVCVNNDGKWEGEQEAWMKAFTRLRVEVNSGDNKFVPLIDGPIVGFDSARSSQPGKSIVTVVAHDDSALLNRTATVEVRKGQKDSDLARQIFLDAQLGGTPDIEDTPAQPDPITDAAVQRGTPMQYLRELARRNQEWHAYVLPGPASKQSIGCFKKFPTEIDGLPELVLLGTDRNMEEFNVTNRSNIPCNVKASTLSISHGQIQTASSSFRDATLLGDEPADPSSANDSTCLLRPGQTDRVSLPDVTKSAAAASSFSLDATGRIVPFCYPAVLSPYRCVLVRISDSQFSSKYLITRVTHTLSRSLYQQSFSMKGNGVTVSKGGNAATPQASASVSASFNVQMSIF
jgi:hypothetical protein